MRHCIFALGLAVLLAATTAAAGAKQHFLAGQDYYSQGRYDKAIDEFEEAYRLDPRPLLLFNIAQSHEKLGNLEEAVEYLEKFLREDPESEQRASLESKIKNLKSRIGSTGIRVTCNELGAAIYVDDVEVGMTPAGEIIPLEVGAHKIRISKEGFKDFTMNMAVSAGHSVPVEATLEPGESAGAGVGGGGEATVDTGEGGGGFMKVLPWIVTGVGAGTAVIGWVVLGGQSKDTDSYNFEERKSKAAAADIVGIAGSAIAVGGVVWGVVTLVKGAKSGKESAAVVVPFADQNTAGLSATFTF